MTDYRRVLSCLADGGVEFILIGGYAAVLHGSARFTQDIDVVYRRSAENLRRLARALAPFNPYPRGAPPGLPFRWDERTLEQGLNFTLQTELGEVDLLGEVAGGNYENLLPDSEELDLGGARLRVVSLRRLIALKRAAGRPRDFDAIAELEALAEEGG
jgi:predicted nucleotidyltransferase